MYLNQRLFGAVSSWHVLAALDGFAFVLLGPGLDVALGELAGVAPQESAALGRIHLPDPGTEDHSRAGWACVTRTPEAAGGSG